ncbi:hypothetical protein BT93_F2797 [Corymbia citriodora subsp. variegata]|nr:hypothetical protein BT93_F2797 [Corymbia citriodora subsp. variegata]
MVMDDYEKGQLSGWVIKIKSHLNQGLTSDAKSLWTIDRVPSNWRGVHNDAFDPQMMRIGPFGSRHGSHRMSVMEGHKMRFLIRLLGGELERWRSDGDVSRTTEGERMSDDRERGEDDGGGRMAKAVLLDDLVEAMWISAKETKACYPNDIDYMLRYGHGFPKMMVVDGCFVVELLRLYYDLFHKKKLDELINEKNNIDHQQAVPLEELAVTFFNPLFPQQNAASKLDAQKPKAHLLDVFRSGFLKSVDEKVHKKGKNQVKSRLNPDGSSRGIVLHFASELQEAGVQFKKWKDHDLLDIEFRHRTLRVPPLSLNDYTISLLLNFVGYELSVNHPEPFFTNYLMFWNSLVNSPRDIQILRKHRIINNMGSEKEVAELLMRCREVIYDLDLGYLFHEIKDVNDYCERYYDSKYHVWWRSLIRERFSSPWICLSLFAAVILLLLILIQTFYAVYAYYRPH